MGRSKIAFAIVLFAFLCPIILSCPDAVASVCKCADTLGGLQLDCSFTEFANIIGDLNQANAQIQRLAIHNSTVAQLPAGAFGNLSIKELDMSGTGLQLLGPGVFSSQQHSTLDTLRLANNSLMALPNLSGLQRLAILDLSGNSITSVPSRAFDQLPNLQVLRLKRNRICTLDAASFNETKSTLTLLDLGSNCLSRVPLESLRGFQKLAWLSLSDNQITDVPNLAFLNLPELREVHLEENFITTLSQTAFMNVGKLQSLFLSNNKLPAVQPDLFHLMQALDLLDIGRNNLMKIPSLGFHDLRSLKNLILDGNKISTLEASAFSNLPNLQVLSLQQNQLSQLSRNAFERLPALAVLLLANNTLTSLDQGSLAGVPSLQQLSLRNNAISSIDKGAFDAVPLMTTLDLAQNGLTSLTPNVFERLVRLTGLDLSQNRIERFAPGTFVRPVHTLLLSGNPLNCNQDFDWFVDYLVKNNVLISLPDQADVTCAIPPDTRVKDLMISRANDTTFRQIGGLPDLLGGTNPLAALQTIGNFIPGLGNTSPGLQTLSGLGTLTNGLINAATGMGPVPAASSPDLMTGINSLASPLARLLTANPNGIPNGTNLASSPEVSALINSLPNFIASLPRIPPPVAAPSGVGVNRAISIPGYPGLDLSKLPPSTIQTVLRGGQLPGVPPALMQDILKKYVAALVANPPPLASLPQELVSQVISGGGIPGVPAEQLNALKQHYTAQMMNRSLGANATAGLGGFDVSVLPDDLLRDLADGRLPDLSKLPPGIAQLLQDDPRLLLQLQSDAQAKTGKKPAPLASLDGTSPYNLDGLQSAVEDDSTLPKQAAWIAGTVLGVLLAITLVVMGVLCWRRRKTMREARDNSSTDGLTVKGGVLTGSDSDLAGKSDLAAVTVVPQDVILNKTFRSQESTTSTVVPPVRTLGTQFYRLPQPQPPPTGRSPWMTLEEVLDMRRKK